MTVKEKLAEFEFFDVAILSHGFAPFMRDYDLVVQSDGPARGTYRCRFTHCPEAHIITTLRDGIWRRSWNDVNIDYQQWLVTEEADGFVWGVCWSMAYPRLTYYEGSALAAQWSERFGQPMHEVTIETQVFRLQLIFHDVLIQKLSDDVGVIDQVIIPLDNQWC
jgi:hypothetical protein